MRTRLALLILAFGIFSAQISYAQDPLTQSMQQMGQQQAQQSLDMAMQQSAQQAQSVGQDMTQQSNFAMQQAMWSSNHAFPAFLIPAAPKFFPKPGQYSTPTTLKIHDASPGTAIHYTPDGSRPTAASPLYTGPIPIISSTTIQAVAIGHNRFWSPVATGVYNLNISPTNPAAQPPQSPEQTPAPQSEEQSQPQFAPAPPVRMVTIPACTKLPLALMDPMYTKSARPGDNGYLETTFPVTVGNEMLVPPGTFVQATIEKISKHGRGPFGSSVAMQVRLGKLTFVGGYAVDIPDSSDVGSSEGGFSVPYGGRTTAAVAAGVGAPAAGIAIGALANGIRGAAIGGPIGAGVGAVAAIILLTRNQDVYIGIGTPMNMTLGSPVTFDIVKAGGPPEE